MNQDDLDYSNHNPLTFCEVLCLATHLHPLLVIGTTMARVKMILRTDCKMYNNMTPDSRCINVDILFVWHCRTMAFM